MTPEEQALFAAGERRGIERSAAFLGSIGFPETGERLLRRIDEVLGESLRDAPAGEAADTREVPHGDTKACPDMWCKGGWSHYPDGSVVGACVVCRGTGRVPNVDDDTWPCLSCGATCGDHPDRCGLCGAVRGYEADGKKAKPEAAGEEPFILTVLRKLAEEVSAYTTVHERQARELVEWLDRPTPAAKEAGERSAEDEVIRSLFYIPGGSYAIDTRPMTSDERLSTLEAARDAIRAAHDERVALVTEAELWKTRAHDWGYDRETGMAGQLVAARRELRELKEERDRLRRELTSRDKWANEIAVLAGCTPGLSAPELILETLRSRLRP